MCVYQNGTVNAVVKLQIFMKDNVVGTVTRVRATRTVVRIAADANEFPLLQNAEISSWVHPASYSVGTGDSFPRR